MTECTEHCVESCTACKAKGRKEGWIAAAIVAAIVALLWLNAATDHRYEDCATIAYAEHEDPADVCLQGDPDRLPGDSGLER